MGVTCLISASGYHTADRRKTKARVRRFASLALLASLSLPRLDVSDIKNYTRVYLELIQNLLKQRVYSDDCVNARLSICHVNYFSLGRDTNCLLQLACSLLPESIFQSISDPFDFT